MHPKRLEINDRLRWLLPTGVACGAALVAALWAAYFYKASQAGDDGRWIQNTFDRPAVWLVLAAAATVVVPVAFLVSGRNFVWLVRHGTEVWGRVVSVSALSHAGSRPVTYAYTVGGTEYTLKRDTPTLWADQYEPGTPVLVLVDPRKPRRATVLNVSE
jgi:hypothetical protein